MIKFLCLAVILIAGLTPEIGSCGLVGEPAPPLKVLEWMKGQPVQVGPGTNIYLLEIWNTTSAASRAVVTNLNIVQNHYQTNGLIVVGISDEPVDKIRAFMQHEGTNIEYAVAKDDKRYTAASYMTPVGERTIPYAFIVGTNGNLLWHGSPHTAMMVEALEQITQGRYDEKLAQKMDLARHQLGQYLALAATGSDRAGVAGKNLLGARTNDATLLCDLAFEIATVPKLTVRDFGLANEALNQAEKLASTNTAQVIITRSIVLFESGQRTDGLNMATQALASAQSPAEKDYVQSCIRSMTARETAAKSHPNNTNQTTHAVSGANPETKDAASKSGGN